MKKVLITGMALAMLAIPSVASADTPTGEFVFKANDGAQEHSNASEIGELSSQIKQNGQFVGGNKHIALTHPDYDQTTVPGSRAAGVQAVHAADGRGSLAVK